jgi:hypothetical protein
VTSGDALRVALCDDDHLYTSIIEVMLNDLGHQVVGVAATTASSVALIEAARPDVVIVDMSLGFNTDFDVVATATSSGLQTIVFSQQADDAILGQYDVRPTVVYKPDLAKLEEVVRRLGLDSTDRPATKERRRRPTRAAEGPEPTGIGDAQAFYGALNAAMPGDGLLSVELPEGGASPADATDIAERMRTLVRCTDRLLASPRVVRVFLTVGGSEGLAVFRARLTNADVLPPQAVIRAVLIADDESPGDAFDRLKSAPPA